MFQFHISIVLESSSANDQCSSWACPYREDGLFQTRECIRLGEISFVSAIVEENDIVERCSLLKRRSSRLIG